MREEIGVLCDRMEVRMYCFVQLLEGIIARTRVGNNCARLELYEVILSISAWGNVVAVCARGAVAYIADVCRRILGLGGSSMRCTQQ